LKKDKDELKNEEDEFCKEDCDKCKIRVKIKYTPFDQEDDGELD
jgi:hypothetical protein